MVNHLGVQPRNRSTRSRRLVAQRRRRPIVQLTLSDLTASEVRAFLQYSEQERGDTIGTRNCRPSELRSSFSFVADRDHGLMHTELMNLQMQR